MSAPTREVLNESAGRPEEVLKELSNPVRFGPFAFDRGNGLLLRDGEVLPLPPRAVGVLSCLLERPGDVVPKQALLDRVWKDTFVSEVSLTEAVSLLRQVLQDQAQSPAYIQTIPRRGYRFVAPVEAGPIDTAAGAAAPAAAVTASPPAVAVRGTVVVPEAPIGRPIPAHESGTERREATWPAWLLWTMGLLLAVVVAGVLTGLLSQGGTAPRQVVRFRLDLGPGLSVDPAAAAFAWAPDGTRLVVAARDAGGRTRLVVRALDTLDLFAIAGTDGAAAPFYSPDGRFVAFFAGGMLKRTRAAPGAPLVLAPAPIALGGVWLSDGTIVFGGGVHPGLSRVHADGGPVQRLTSPALEEGEVRHGWPASIARDRLLLYTAIAADERLASARILVSDASGLARRVLVEGAAFARPAAPAHLVLLRPGGLFGMPFDDAFGTITGPERLLRASLGADPARAAAQLAISKRGALALVPQDADAVPLDSPAGLRTPDGLHEVVAQRLDGPFNLVKRSVRGDGPVLRLTSSPHNQRPVAIQPDGRTLVFEDIDPHGAIAQWTVDLDGQAPPTRAPATAVAGPASASSGTAPGLEVTLEWSTELARHVPIRPRDVRTVR